MTDIKQALQCSRDTWFTKAMRLFDRAAIDEAVWTELEELLIAADMTDDGQFEKIGPGEYRLTGAQQSLLK